MKKVIFFLLTATLTFFTSLNAQAPVQQELVITLNLKPQEVEYVLQKLAKLPLEEVGPLFFKIDGQYADQLKAAKAKAMAPAAKDSTKSKPKGK